MEIPLIIKSWFNSEPMAEIYEALAEKFGIDVSAITLTIYYLESKKISPADFTIELQKRSGKTASPELIKQIIDRVFAPIKNDLLEFGIDIDLIQAPADSTTIASVPPTPTIPSATASTPTISTPTPTPAPASQPVPPASTPYILHQEAAFKTLSEEHDINYEPIKRAFFSSSQPPAPTFKEPTGPAKIQFSGQQPEVPAAPKEQEVARTEAFVPKIVHYSTLMTPLSPFGNSKGTIAPQPTEPPAPAPAAPTTEPKLPQTKFNDEIIEEVAKSAASPEKIDLKDLPL